MHLSLPFLVFICPEHGGGGGDEVIGVVLWVGKTTGYPVLFQGNPHLYSWKPIPVFMGMGFLWVWVKGLLEYMRFQICMIIIHDNVSIWGKFFSSF